MNDTIICKICGQPFKTYWALSKHITDKHNISKQEYYDKYFKKPGEGLCYICGNTTKFLGKINYGYNKFCCKECYKLYMSKTNSSETYKQKVRKTLKEKYGEDVENAFQLKIVKEKIENTCLQKFGVKYATQSDKMKENSKKTKLEKYNNENYTNREKALKTCEEKYGNKYWNNSEQNKITCFEKYGETNPMKVQEIKENFFKKYKEKTGYDTPFNNPKVIEKRKENYYNKTGYYYNSQNPEVHKKQMCCRYTAPNGKNYDSSWEYKFEQYLIESKIQYEYQPNITFKWIDFEGIERTYLPDFKLIYPDGKVEIVEIKGDQFFDKENNYIDPHDKTEIGLFNAKQKYNCMIDNGIKILRRTDLKLLGIKL